MSKNTTERKGWHEMVGELFREAGVLVAVLGMLEKVLQGGWPGWAWTGAVLGTGLILSTFGVIIEMRRP